MFTVEQIKDAHSKVKSGADFPAYIRAINKLGISSYETFVCDGHTVYTGSKGHKVTAPAKYPLLTISEAINLKQFSIELKAHQEGKTDYKAFVEMCAGFGIDKWAVSMKDMTCTYCDKLGNPVLVELIPQ